MKKQYRHKECTDSVADTYEFISPKLLPILFFSEK
jgi:hypothetical protein